MGSALTHSLVLIRVPVVMDFAVPVNYCCLSCQVSEYSQIWLLLLLLLLRRFSCVPTLCDPIDGSPPGSPVPGILQARTGVGCHFFLQFIKVKSESEVAQSCPTLSDPMDCSPPSSSDHGIFQARVLEWVAIAFS